MQDQGGVAYLDAVGCEAPAEVEARDVGWLLRAKIVGLFEQIKRDDLERAKSVRWCATAKALRVSPTPDLDRAREAAARVLSGDSNDEVFYVELAQIRSEQQEDARQRAAMRKAAVEAQRLATKAQSEADALLCFARSQSGVVRRRRDPHRSGLKVGRPVARCTRGQGSASPPKEGNGSDSSGSDGAGPPPARRAVESVVVAAIARCAVLQRVPAHVYVDRVARTAIWDAEGLAEWLALALSVCRLLGEPV